MSRNKAFAKNVIIVSLGPIIAAIFSFLSEPFIARFWEPKLFGEVSFFNSLIMIIAPALFLRYNFSIVQSKNYKEASNLLAISFIIITITCALLFLCYPLFSYFFKNSFNFNKFILPLFLGLIFSAFNIIFRHWNAFKKQFFHVSISTILLQASFTLLLLIFGYKKLTTSNNIVWIRATSYILCPLLMILSFLKKDLLKVLKDINLKQMITMAKKYKKFPLIEVWGFLANLLTFNIVIVLVANYWGQEINGLFSKAYFILIAFVFFLGDSINRVLHKEIAELTKLKQNIAPLLQNVIYSLFLISVLPFTMLMLIGPQLFSVFLGKTWLQAGVFAQIISIWLFAMLIDMSILPTYAVLNKQGKYSIFKISLLVSQVAILSICGALKCNVYLSILIFCVSNFLLMLFQALYILKFANVNIKNLSISIFKKITQLLPLIVIVKAITSFLNLTNFNVILITSILTLPYCYLFFIKNYKNNPIIKNILKPKK